MRRSALIAGVVAAGIVAAPARAATTEVTVSNFSFSPGAVTIAPGDTVVWRFAGPDLNHSATSDAGQSESWDSDPGDPNPLHAPGDTFAHAFAAAGSFTYHCKVHGTMRARVTVAGPGDPGQPPAADTTAPAITSLRARTRRLCAKRTRTCRRPRTTLVTFALDEPARVTAELRGPTPRTIERNGRAGENRLRLSATGLKPGLYRLALTATDAAGNRSRTKSVVLSVRPG